MPHKDVIGFIAMVVVAGAVTAWRLYPHEPEKLPTATCGAEMLTCEDGEKFVIPVQAG